MPYNPYQRLKASPSPRQTPTPRLRDRWRGLRESANVEDRRKGSIGAAVPVEHDPTSVSPAKARTDFYEANVQKLLELRKRGQKFPGSS